MTSIGDGCATERAPPTSWVSIDVLSIEVRARVVLSGEIVKEYAEAMTRAKGRFPPVVIFNHGEVLWKVKCSLNL